MVEGLVLREECLPLSGAAWFGLGCFEIRCTGGINRAAPAARLPRRYKSSDIRRSIALVVIVGVVGAVVSSKHVGVLAISCCSNACQFGIYNDF